MSEYQYYEFQAIDRALTEAERAEVAELSSRVNLSPHRAVFTYNYGDFRGDPVTLLAKSFDAMLYLANWGSRWLYFRFPGKLITPEALAPYCVDDCISTFQSGDFVVLGITMDEDDGDYWMEGDGALPPLLPLRQQILEGDYRALYLAWLKASQFVDDEDEEDRLEPPVPPGLCSLSSSLEAFVEFFEIDADLLAVAAKASRAIAPETDLEPLLSALTEAERCEFLRGVLSGDPGVATKLRLRLREIASQQQPSVLTTEPSSRRLLSDLLQSAGTVATGRAQQAKQAQEAARLRKLEGVAENETRLWTQASALVAQKNIKAYNEAIGIFKDLHELAKHRDQLSSFTARVQQLQQQYPGLSGLRSRLKEAGLLPKLS